MRTEIERMNERFHYYFRAPVIFKRGIVVSSSYSSPLK